MKGKRILQFRTILGAAAAAAKKKKKEKKKEEVSQPNLRKRGGTIKEEICLNLLHAVLMVQLEIDEQNKHHTIENTTQDDLQ